MGRDRDRAINRVRSVLSRRWLFTWAPQGRGVRRTGQRFFFFHLGELRLFYLDLRGSLHDLIAAHLHDLELRDHVTLEPHELNISWRLAVDPFFVLFAFLIFLPDALRRTADRIR